MAARQPGFARGTGDTRSTDVLLEVATRFYIRGLTQVQIAHDMELDPSTVSRYLKRARDEGIVKVEIRPPRRPNADLERGVAERFGLARCIVASDAFDALSFAAAGYVGGLLRAGMRIGLGWGMTLQGVVRALDPGTVTGLVVCQLAGGLSESEPGIQAHELAREFASLFPESRVQYLHAPSIVDSPAIHAAIMSDSSVQAALLAAAGCDLAVVGVGQMTGEATLLHGGILTRADRSRLVRLGAVGSMNARFFDDGGRPVTWLDDRTIAISWDDLQAIPMVVAVAGGIGKIRAIRGALATRSVDVLVTDEGVARALLA